MSIKNNKRNARSSSYVSWHVQSFKGIGNYLLKLELFKDKTLIRISLLQHIHHKNRPISSAFNAIRKSIISKTSKVTSVNTNKTNELIVPL